MFDLRKNNKNDMCKNNSYFDPRLIKLIAELDVDEIVHLFGNREFLEDPISFEPELCKTVPHGCDDALFLLCGPTHHVNETRIQVYVSETPAGWFES